MAEPRQVPPHIVGAGYICAFCEQPHIPGCTRDRDASTECANASADALLGAFENALSDVMVHPTAENRRVVRVLRESVRSVLARGAEVRRDGTLRLQVDSHNNVGVWLYGGEERADDAIVKLCDATGRPIAHVNAAWLKALHDKGPFGFDEPRQAPTSAPEATIAERVKELKP